MLYGCVERSVIVDQDGSDLIKVCGAQCQCGDSDAGRDLVVLRAFRLRIDAIVFLSAPSAMQCYLSAAVCL